MAHYLNFAFLLCLLLLSIDGKAQGINDFAPFRWDIQYIYHHPAEGPEWTTISPLSMPYVGVLQLPQGDAENKYMLYPQAEEGQYRMVTHFTGTSFDYGNPEEATLNIYDGDLSSPAFIIRYGAVPGASWEPASGLLSTVDSVVTESFFGEIDEVKYISTVRLTDNTRLPDIKIARHYGLLQGFHFTDQEYAEQVISIAGIASWEQTLGEPFVFPGAVAAAEPNDDYFEVKEEQVSGGTRVTHRILRNRGFDRCDPIIDAIERLFYKREISYFRPADGSPNRDSVVQPPQDEYILISNASGSYYDHSWVTTGLGTLHQEAEQNAGYVHLIEHASDECYTVGVRRSRPLEYVTGSAGLLKIAEEPMMTPTFYHSIARPDLDEDQGFRLVGVNTHRVTCGEQFDFDRFYTSTYDFPNDERITLAPNPATDRTMFSVPFDLGPVNLTVYDAAGRELRKTALTGGDRWLETGDLTAGVYTVVVANQEGPVARRRVVVR